MFNDNPPSLAVIIGSLEEDKKLKAALEADLDEVKARIRQNEMTIISAITDLAVQSGTDDPEAMSVTIGGRRYGVAQKTHYRVMAANRQAVMDALQERGYGDLISTNLNEKALTNAINEAVEQNGAIPDDFADLPLESYTDMKLTNRKA